MKFKGTFLNKFLWVGDLHVKKDNIEESVRIIKWIKEVSLKYNLPIVFAGDQYNDFGIARVECVTFWNWAYGFLTQPTISIVGNHDMNSDGSLNFMTVHGQDTLVVNEPTVIGKTGILPFYRNNESFVSVMNMADVEYLLCHQEFNGAKFDNGFFAPGGVDPKQIPSNIIRVISGHIHTAQSFDKIWYPGTPRHLTRSDIGQIKGIWIIDNNDGTEFIPTPQEVSESFQSFEVTTEDQMKNIPDSSRVYVDIKGTDEFIKKMIKKVPDSVKTRTFPIQSVSVSSIKESEGIPKAFLDFTLNYFNEKGIGTSEAKLILSKIYEKCPSLKSGVS